MSFLNVFHLQAHLDNEPYIAVYQCPMETPRESAGAAPCTHTAHTLSHWTFSAATWWLTSPSPPNLLWQRSLKHLLRHWQYFQANVEQHLSIYFRYRHERNQSELLISTNTNIITLFLKYWPRIFYPWWHVKVTPTILYCCTHKGRVLDQTCLCRRLPTRELGCLDTIKCKDNTG